MAFPLPTVLNNSVMQFIVKGACSVASDCENVLYGLYTTGSTPTAGGLTLDVLTKNFLAAYAGFWRDHMSSQSTMDSCTGRVVTGFQPTGGTKYKVVADNVWVDNTQFFGTVVSDPLPDFASYRMEKKLSVAGRGRNGALRVWGVPETSSLGGLLDSTVFAALQAALDLKQNTFLVGTVGSTDSVELRVVNGKAINTATPPGSLAPNLALQRIFQTVLSQFFGSQITRKLGRKRRHLSAATLRVMTEEHRKAVERASKKHHGDKAKEEKGS